MDSVCVSPFVPCSYPVLTLFLCGYWSVLFDGTAFLPTQYSLDIHSMMRQPSLYPPYILLAVE